MTLTLVLTILIGSTFLRLLTELLNLKHIDPKIPKEFEGVYSPEKYKQSQHYLRDHTRQTLIRTPLMALVLIIFLLADGFDSLDLWVRTWASQPILQGLTYIGILGAISWMAALPFQIIHTFVIEARYQFNTTTPKTFVLDQIKAIFLSILLGGIALTGVLWFFDHLGASAWWVAWMALTLFQLFVTFIAPVVILPLFNKLTPLPEGELKTAIETYAREQNFHLQGIFTMDSSKRSTKGNAFFTGFGKFRRIVFFDTLISKHSPEELVAIMAHEVGHFKKHHVLKHLLYSVALSCLMFYLLAWVIHSPLIFSNLGMTYPSIHAGLVFFGILYSPLSQFFSLIGHHFSRADEFEADAFSLQTYPKPKRMASALKKLSVDNLGNLKPHPLKVWLDYTHPPMLKRLERL